MLYNTLVCDEQKKWRIRMKQLRVLACLILVLALMMTGCSKEEATGDNTDGVDTTTDNSTDSTDATDTDTTGTGTDAAVEMEELDYTTGLDDNGFFEGITAVDLVDLIDYKNIVVPKERYEVADELIQTEIDTMLSYFPTVTEVMDRAIVDGDTVNIDYVGSVDGVEFDGGSTGGAGTEVIIGETQYIDDFLAQLIGHTPGESFDIEVTFPEAYGVETLNGKDAIFAITVNYIKETENAELTDAFVAENLSEMYDWTTVEEMRTSMREDMQAVNVSEYLQEVLLSDSTVNELPETVVEYQTRAMENYYKTTAVQYSMKVDEFLAAYVGFDSLEAMIESSQDQINDSVKYALVIQAIAEDADIVVDEEVLAGYFLEFTGSEDFSQFADQYGTSYLKFSILQEKILDYLTEIITLG